MTRDFYDSEDATYRTFWDPDGSLHWGIFEDHSTGFLAGCRRWNEEMLLAAGIGPTSRVLDLGCGNGSVAAWLARETGAAVTGIDLSAVRITSARGLAAENPDLRLAFTIGSAAALPFDDGAFTHVLSQAALYHVHARETALGEAMRVLEPGGIFAFDDLVTPVRPVTRLAREVVYDRLLFEPTFSADDYVDALARHGFVVYETRDLSSHLARSYELLSDRARHLCPSLARAYRRIPEVVQSGHVGWSFFLCQKVVGKLAWIYQPDRWLTLEQKYDAWAPSYDADLGSSYLENPRRAAALLSRFLPAGAGPLLDAGAGTGLVGEELRRLGHTDLTALDRSGGMLAHAQAKGVYRWLVHGTLAEAPSLFPERYFSAVVAVGVFTFAHAEATDLAALDWILEPGGFLVIAVSADYLSRCRALSNTLGDLGYEVVGRDSYDIFDGEPMNVLAYQKPNPIVGVA